RFSGVENFGIVDDRDDMARLTTYLNEHPVQVWLGIHAQALPDRGTLRKLDHIATHAKHGVIVQLLHQENHEALSDNTAQVSAQIARYQQWQTALAARKIGLVQTP